MAGSGCVGVWGCGGGDIMGTQDYSMVVVVVCVLCLFVFAFVLV